MPYKDLFFDLDHTLWDFDANSRLTLQDLFSTYQLEQQGVDDFDRFHQQYLLHNDKLWERYRKGYVKSEELRWKRMWLTLLDFKIANEKLARELGGRFIELLPYRNLLFPHTIEILEYLADKNYRLHLITNGFEQVQHNKLKNASIDKYFIEVITSEGSNSLKPKKEIFDYALKRARTAAADSIMLGDSVEADIIGGMNAGMDQVHVNHINLSVTNVKPTYTVYCLKELENIL